MPERLEEKSLPELASLKASMSAEYKTLNDEVKEELIRKLPMIFQSGDQIKELLELVNKRIEDLEHTPEAKEQS
jgi:hypothetical protein